MATKNTRSKQQRRRSLGDSTKAVGRKNKKSTARKSTMRSTGNAAFLQPRRSAS
jgi:hypothetical protein